MGSEILIINTSVIEIDNHNPHYWVIKNQWSESSELLDLGNLDLKTLRDLKFILNLEIKRRKDQIDFDGYFEAINKRFKKEIKIGMEE